MRWRSMAKTSSSADRAVISLDDAFAYFINRSYRLLRTHFLKMTREAGEELTPEQYFLLNKLFHQPGQAQTELAAELNDRANVTRGLDILEKRGWSERRGDPADRRKHKVYLTAAGSALVQRLNPMILEERRRIYAGLSDLDLREFRRILGKIEANLML